MKKKKIASKLNTWRPFRGRHYFFLSQEDYYLMPHTSLVRNFMLNYTAY